MEATAELTALGYIGVRSARLDDWVRLPLVCSACSNWIALARCGPFAWMTASSA
jgi:hypothetical protein